MNKENKIYSKAALEIIEGLILAGTLSEYLYINSLPRLADGKRQTVKDLVKGLKIECGAN